jgi:hypothetical protein
VRLAQIEQTLKHPEALGGDTVHKLNTYQTMLNEVKAYIKAIEDGSATPLAA